VVKPAAGREERAHAPTRPPGIVVDSARGQVSQGTWETHAINKHNTNPESFIWTAKAEDILAKVESARAVLHNGASA